MTSLKLCLENSVLYVQLNRQVSKAELVVEVTATLSRMIDNRTLSGNGFIAVNGASPLVVAYAIAHVLAQHYATVATYDPKLPGYIVVKSSTDEYELGEIVNLPDHGVDHPIKVVLCGPPQTGKSCLRAGLKRSLMAKFHQGQSAYPFVFEACPDGEGSWYPDTAHHNPELARTLKTQYASDFTSDYVQETAQAVQNLALPLTLIDLGGRISDENRAIVRGANFAVILWRDRFPDNKENPYYKTLEEWEQFCQDQGLKVIARLRSDLNATSDIIFTRSPLLEGTIHRLRRGNDSSNRLCVQALSDIIVDLCST